MGILTLLVAIGISAVAAWYSIIGLMAIFSAAAIAIAIMGGVLEVGKLVTASWLYQNWKRVPKILKGYLTGAVVVFPAPVSGTIAVGGTLGRYTGDPTANLRAGTVTVVITIDANPAATANWWHRKVRNINYPADLATAALRAAVTHPTGVGIGITNKTRVAVRVIGAFNARNIVAV